MKALLTFAFSLFIALAFSQENTEEYDSELEKVGKNEINVNGLYIVFKAIEINYERFLDEDISIGLAGSYWFGESVNWDYNALAYGRFYPFTDRPNYGLFLELNAGIYNSVEDVVIQSEPPGFTTISEEESLGFGLGIAIGAKFYSYKGYTFNFYGGVNRNFIEDQDPQVIPRVGINIGKRF